MRQRAMIAMAIANDPDLIIADEPTTALDVTIQAQVLEVLKKAKEVTNAATVLITHDLGVVAGFADRVMVMYAGKAVETAAVDDIFYHPRMPYTMGLLGSIPRMDVAEKEPLIPIEGTPPSLVGLPAGCPFAPRCPIVVEKCRTVEPGLDPTDRAGALRRLPSQPGDRPAQLDRRRRVRPAGAAAERAGRGEPRPARGGAAAGRAAPGVRDQEGRGDPPHGRLRFGRWTVSAWTSDRARRWAWSASPAAARPPPSWKS